MQLELINSLRKMEIASGNNRMVKEKPVGQFLSMINSLQTTNQQENPSQIVTQDQQKEDLNQLLKLLSRSPEEISDEEISMSLEKLWNTYFDISDQGNVKDFESADMEGLIAETFVKIENRITQVLKEGENSRIAPEMFNQTELPDLLADLKLLEKTVKNLPDLTINEKIAETVQDLQRLIFSLNNYLELNVSNPMKNSEKAAYTNQSMGTTDQAIESKHHNVLSSKDNILPSIVKNTAQNAEQNVESFGIGESELEIVAFNQKIANPTNSMITNEAIYGKENLASGDLFASIAKEIENQKVNNGILKNSTMNSLSEDIAKTINLESIFNHNKEDFPNVFSRVDTKLLALQNSLLQENKNVIDNESKRTTQSNFNQVAEADNHVTAATTELKTIISSILAKLDKQLVEKNMIVVPKMVNPIMVSSLRKSGELLTSTAETKGNVKVGEADADAKVFTSISTTFMKQDPLMLLSNSGEMIHPKKVEEQFAKLLANSTFTKTGDMQKLSIRLAPDHLGSIRIEITQNEGNMIARIITANSEAKDVLEKQLTSLKHGLSAQNLQVDKMDIVVSSQPQERLQREQQQQQEQQQSHPQRNKKDADDEENQRKASFFEELLNIEV
ncbi:flagellar hook-length control protein FliK [Niallia sp. FSL M8-0099]|uniref:flagellar hook-length control protein FliK n=1 Tax=Niallia sp. FSL M8-0099 TaxID=2954519 RepID=UPI001642ED2A